MINYNIPKSLLLKAEQNYGLDTVDQVLSDVSKQGIDRALQNYQYSEMYDHEKCLTFLYLDDE
jgi:hypothetical protein